jgi:hypothetical protein
MDVQMKQCKRMSGIHVTAPRADGRCECGSFYLGGPLPPASQNVPVEQTREYKQFIEWYRNQFELGYPDGLGFDLVKAAFLAGHAKAVEDEYS